MPVHDVGYRSWTGQLGGTLSRVLAITVTGCRLSIKSTWVKRILFFAWLPILFWGVGLYVGESALQESGPSLLRGDRRESRFRREFSEEFGDVQRQSMGAAIKDTLGFMPQAEMLGNAIQGDDPDETRRIVWRWLLMTFFRYPQAIAMVFLLGFVVPGLVARDFRSRAFLLYFSRPIGRLEYVLGKLLVPAVFLVFISTLPALALYVTGLFLSPDLSVVGLTWDVPLRVLAATVLVVLPTASLSIALSSLTHESRFASFAWFAVWLLGYGAWSAVLISQTASVETQEEANQIMANMTVWSPLSIYVALGEVQNWVFGFSGFRQIWPSFLMLFLLTAGSLAVFWRRIGRSIQA